MINYPQNSNIYVTFFVFIVCLLIWAYQARKSRLKRSVKKKPVRKTQIKKYKEPAIDPEMFSSEPLDLDKAKNLKYKAYIEAQNEELKKNSYY